MVKKHLLKPPSVNEEIFLLPSLKIFFKTLARDDYVSTAHQPYFFNPGVAAKFIFLDKLGKAQKRFLFLDTDKVKVFANIPYIGGGHWHINFLDSLQALYDYKSPSPDKWLDFFSFVQTKVKDLPQPEGILDNVSRFKEIVLSKRSGLLKEVLAESFLEYFNIKRKYTFISDILDSKEYKDFFERILKDSNKFKDIFNDALDRYKQEFRFRYKNFPFPKLEEDELPFWLITRGKRARFRQKDLKNVDLGKELVFPRACTLTLFLRLYYTDIFIHGIGGGNYEWINNFIIKEFFLKTPKRYVVMSGTFFLQDIPDREGSYFLFSPKRIKKRVNELLSMTS